MRQLLILQQRPCCEIPNRAQRAEEICRCRPNQISQSRRLSRQSQRHVRQGILLPSEKSDRPQDQTAAADMASERWHPPAVVFQRHVRSQRRREYSAHRVRGCPAIRQIAAGSRAGWRPARHSDHGGRQNSSVRQIWVACIPKDCGIHHIRHDWPQYAHRPP